MCRLAASAYAPIGMRRPYGISHSSIGFGPGMPRTAASAAAAACGRSAASPRRRRRRPRTARSRSRRPRARRAARSSSRRPSCRRGSAAWTPRYSARPVGDAAVADAVDVVDRQPGVVERGVGSSRLRAPGRAGRARRSVRRRRRRRRSRPVRAACARSRTNPFPGGAGTSTGFLHGKCKNSTRSRVQSADAPRFHRRLRGGRTRGHRDSTYGREYVTRSTASAATSAGRPTRTPTLA